MPSYLVIAQQVASKELRSFFNSPSAYLFLAAFLGAVLFNFFWLEVFFARNIADVRPLFEGLPLLLIFLIAAITMRSWSEELRSGTLESLITSPSPPFSLVLGKFLGSWLLVLLALALTLPIPVSISLIGNIDWGPVVGAYVASALLAAAYISIGLCMSARTDNPIVALILTTLTCGIFYFIGSDLLASLFGHHIGGWLSLAGTGSRFDSVSKGVLDVRDFYYYFSIVGIFLILNLLGLERLRWAGNPLNPVHSRTYWFAGLLIANLLAGNIWLQQINGLRIDITEDQNHSISNATETQLNKLREPLLLHGYFSTKTHPLLAPLIPQLKDLLNEYKIAGKSNVKVIFSDPTENREMEEEAAATYGVKPVPFQTADRHQSAIVNSYFDIVIAYGDEYQTLGFQELIEIKASGDRDLDVVLKNPEYAITRSIRKVTNAFQSSGNIFDLIDAPIKFHGYISSKEKLPEELADLRDELESILLEIKSESGNQLQIDFQDPDAQNGATAEFLQSEYGFSPQIASLLNPEPFWFYMVLETEEELIQVPLPEALDATSIEKTINAALQRLAPGFLKTLAIAKPEGYGPGGQRYSQLEAALQEEMRLNQTTLESGIVPEDADLLLVLSPESFTSKQVFAIDQFLMRGGSVIIATSPFNISLDQGLEAIPFSSGLEEWLDTKGINIQDTLVLDASSGNLPVPVERSIGGLTFRDIQMLKYPHFPDLRTDGLNQNNPITSSLDQITLSWVSPITVSDPINMEYEELLKTSKDSWTSSSVDLIPDYDSHPENGFSVDNDTSSQVLAVSLEGTFESFFKDKESPLLEPSAEKSSTPVGEGGTAEGAEETEETVPVVTSVIERSSDASRLIVIASNNFASDVSLDLVSQSINAAYSKPIAMIQNAIDWSLEDEALLSLRGKTMLARTLTPMSGNESRIIEYLNYFFTVVGILLVWLWRRNTDKKELLRQEQLLTGV